MFDAVYNQLVKRFFGSLRDARLEEVGKKFLLSKGFTLLFGNVAISHVFRLCLVVAT